MSASAILLAILKFACWEAALFAASIRLARLIGWRRRTVEFWLAVLAIEVTLESSFAAMFSFAGMNSAVGYWAVAVGCVMGFLLGGRTQAKSPAPPLAAPIIGAFIAALVVPLVLLSFKPVEEIDSINYLHYLIEWMANRATPYTFATNYVAFWELSFVPAWMVTGVDLFFPMLALKAVALLALGLLLLGKEFNLPDDLLLWTVFGCIVMQHFWYGPSGVPTLKNDALHGVGFVLMTVVVLRAASRTLTSSDVALLAFGLTFGAVKYTGVFVGAIALVVVMILARGRRTLAALAIAAFFLLTSGHYYLHNLIRYGSPFYPFQINLAFLHLRGTADLSNTSILYSLHDPRLWRALFLPSGGFSPAGLLFPAILAATLLAGTGRCGLAAFHLLVQRTKLTSLDWAAFLILCGWLLYFRSVFSASASPGDLTFILNGLNSIRYVDGVLAASEIFLVALLARSPWLAASLVTINLGSRLVMLYGKLELFSPLAVCALAVTVLLLFVALQRRALAVAICVLAGIGPFVLERNREQWTTYWNDLKPALKSVRGKETAELALPDGGYYAGHVVVAGNPIDTSVRCLPPETMDALAASLRPRYLVVLPTPGTEAASLWQVRYGPRIRLWGYQMLVAGKNGAIFERVKTGIAD